MNSATIKGEIASLEQQAKRHLELHHQCLGALQLAQAFLKKTETSELLAREAAKAKAEAEAEETNTEPATTG